MAHAAQLSTLTDELVDIIAGHTPGKNAQGFKVCKELATRKLRPHRFGRTNQFHVRSSLEGLVEKFEILNKDDLAGQLRSWLHDLESCQYRWKPEVLSLLLLLSDRPAERTSTVAVEDSDNFDIAPTLTWNDIIANDPIIETDLWKDVGRGTYDLFEDETTVDESAISVHTDETSASSAGDCDNSNNAEMFVIPVCGLSSDMLKAMQMRKIDSLQLVESPETELQIVREVLHALLGLPSRFCIVNEQTREMTASQGLALRHASRLSLCNLISSFTVVVIDLHILRNFCKRSHTIPLVQTFSSCVSRKLQEFDLMITKIERSNVGIKQSSVVSLLDIYAEINMHTEFIQIFTKMISTVDNLAEDLSFRLLDELYDRTCLANALGARDDYRIVVEAFLDCLITYLRPLLRWMEDGYLDPKDVLCPFMFMKSEEPPKFWTERFAIRYSDGEPKAPRFIRGLLPEMFASGKDVAFSKALGLADKLNANYFPSGKQFDIQPLRELPPISASPFSALLYHTLQEWMSSRRQKIWEVLRRCIFANHGLWRTISALEVLYLSSSGHLTGAFSEAIFMRLDDNKLTWDDPYIVEEIAKETFGLSQHIQPEHLHAVRIPNMTPQSKKSIKGMECILLDLSYPWSIQNIISPSTRKTYQRVFTFLLQIERARSVLALQNLRVLSSCSEVAKHQASSYMLRIDLRHLDLRHRLIWFVTTLQNYLFNSVIAPASLELRKAMQTATGVDAMIMSHSKFIRDIEQGCLLANELSSCRGALLSLLDLAILVADPGRQEARQGENINHTADEAAKSSADRGTMDINAIRQIGIQYHRLLAYATTDLRTASRTPGAAPVWETLVEMLEIGVGET